MGALPSWPPLNLPKVPFSNTITHVRTSFSRGYKYSVHYIYNILIFFYTLYIKYQFSSFQLLSRVWLFVTPWTAACQASLSITNSQSLLKLCPLSQWCHPTISSSVIPFSFCLQSFPASGSFPMSQFFVSGGQSIFSFSISPSTEYAGLISFRMDWLDFLAVQGTLKSLLQHHSSKASILWHSAFFMVQLSHP